MNNGITINGKEDVASERKYKLESLKERLK